MVARVRTVAFEGVDVRPVDAQVQVSGGMPAFTLVGLPDKAVGESRERVRAGVWAAVMFAAGVVAGARVQPPGVPPGSPLAGHDVDLAAPVEVVKPNGPGRSLLALTPYVVRRGTAEPVRLNEDPADPAAVYVLRRGDVSVFCSGVLTPGGD